MPKILVADDEEDFEVLMRQRFRRRIRTGEIDFVFAANGEEALKLLKDDPAIQVLLTDINMPRMDGLALLNELADVRPDIRAVVVSAYGDMENIRNAMNSGAFDFVTKPIDFKDLEITLDKTMEHVALIRDAEAQEQELTAIRKELDVARRLQQSILPRKFPEDSRFDLYAEMHPARAVGGDFFDIFPLEGDRIGMVVGDVAGKGVPAALFMAIARTTLKATALSGCAAGDCLSRVNDQISDHEPENMLVTLAYLVYEPASGRLSYANAGHDLPILRRADGHIENLENPDGVIAGVKSGLDYVTRELTLEPGDRLFVYSDGIVDARSSEGERYSLEQFTDGIAGLETGLSARDTVLALLQEIDGFTGDSDQADDMTCMVLARIT
jgi:sigma-B regulation protein RsbU (phosphoserine phosphatase)